MTNEFYQDSEDELWNKEIVLPEEFKDLLLVMENGAIKHGHNSWLNETNLSMEHKANHASMFRHLACSYAGEVKDKESGLDHLLHLATRALMCYTRKKRGINANEEG
jgi:hypothetical protein